MAESALLSILSNLKKKYAQLNSFYEATRKLHTVFAEGEEAEVAGLLAQRQSAMSAIDALDAHNKALLKELTPALREKIGHCMKPSGVTITLDNPLHTNIYETSKKNFALTKRAAEADRELHRLFPR